MSFDVTHASDVGRLRALSHPLRLRLLEALKAAGPLTATDAAARVGSTPSNCSFHLRQLARHGYVVEDPVEPGSGRRRPWRVADVDVEVHLDDLDADGRDAARQLVLAALDQQRQRALDWLAHRDHEPAEWRAAVGGSQLMLDITADELRRVREEVFALFKPYLARGARRRSDGARAVMAAFSALPARGATGADSSPDEPESDDSTRSDHADQEQR